MKKGPIIYECDDGKKLITMKASGINIFVVCCDGLSIAHFPKDKKPYLLVPEVLAWYKQEIKHCQDPKIKRAYQSYIDYLEKVPTA